LIAGVAGGAAAVAGAGRGAARTAQQRHFAEEVAASEADWLVRKNDLDSPG